MRYFQWLVDGVVLTWWALESQYWGLRYQAIKQCHKLKQRFKKKSATRTTTYVDIGAGRQFETIGQFNAWLSQRDLVANDENIIARVHSDQKVTHDFVPFNSKGLIILKPAPQMDYDEK